MTCQIDGLTADALSTVKELLGAYTRLSGQTKVGKAHQIMYGEILEFVNFRMETIETCTVLVEQRRIADALGLSRSVLEHALLLKLLCRGNRYFELTTFQNLTDSAFKTKAAEWMTQHAAQVSAGTTQVAEVRVYKRTSKTIMKIFDRLKDSSELPDESLREFSVPIHYFYFQGFVPETMRLKDEDYFTYRKSPPALKKALSDHRKQAKFTYQHYLSYDALLECLELNGLVDDAAQARIDAHYTFLGRFLHPTHEAARQLHDNANWHTQTTEIGMGRRYSSASALLASTYLVHLLCDILDEVAGMLDRAPSYYIEEPGTDEIKALAADARVRFPYLWLVFNDPTNHDKFNHWNYLPEVERRNFQTHHDVPKERVLFNKDIYTNFTRSLGG